MRFGNLAAAYRLEQRRRVSIDRQGVLPNRQGNSLFQGIFHQVACLIWAYSPPFPSYWLWGAAVEPLDRTALFQ